MTKLVSSHDLMKKWGIKGSFSGPMVLFCLAILIPGLIMALDKPNCSAQYNQKIHAEGVKGENLFYRAIKGGPERYQRVLSLLEKAVANNVDSRGIKAFRADLLKKYPEKQKELTPVKITAYLREFDRFLVVCAPKVNCYKTLLDGFYGHVEKVNNLLLNPGPLLESIKQEQTMSLIAELDKVAKGYAKATGKRSCGTHGAGSLGIEELSSLVLLSSQPVKSIMPKKSAKGPDYSCGICMDDFKKSDMFQSDLCNCKGNPSVCKDCMKQHVAISMKEGRVVNDCAVCKKALSQADLVNQGIVDVETAIVSQLRNAVMEAQDKCPNFNKCPGGRCPGGSFSGGKNEESYCKLCGEYVKNCDKCGKKDHKGKTCEEIWGERVRECEALGASACPNCWVPIQHGGDCMHMTCPRCQAEYSEVTKLPMAKKGTVDGVFHDEGGWPEHFYPNGRYQAGKRMDQKGRSIDVYGNLLTKLKRKVDLPEDGTSVEVNEEVIVSRDGKKFFTRDAETKEIWEIDGRTFARKGKKPVPYEQHYQFKGERDQIVAKVRREYMKKILKANVVAKDQNK